MTENIKLRKHKTVSLSLNITTTDMVWVVRNEDELAQNRGTLSPEGLVGTPLRFEELKQ